MFVAPAIAVPPVATVYQLYWPLVPPEAVSVIVTDGQPLAPVAVGAGVMTSVAVTGVLALSHVPLLMATKKFAVAVVTVGEYVALVSPGKAVPPVATVYQRYCPAVPPAAVIGITAEGPQAGVGCAGMVGCAGSGLTVSFTIFEKTSGAKSPDTLQR